MKLDLAKGVDPRAWVKTHPWITLASAAAAGFAAAAAVVPSKEEQALKRLAAIERALDGSNGRHEHATANGDHSHEHTGFVGMILKELVGIVKPLLTTLLASHLNPQPREDGQGDSNVDPESQK